VDHAAIDTQSYRLNHNLVRPKYLLVIYRTIEAVN
jgi:hypothetical protein